MKTIDPTGVRLAAVIQSSEDAIISQALDGTIETWNPAAERMFGYTAAEAVGQKIDLIVPAECREQENDTIARLHGGEGGRHFETLGLTRAGVRIPVSLSLSLMVTPDDDVIGVSRIARDITKQKAFEREAFRLAAIVDFSEDAIASKDLNGIVQTWNKAAERMFGYTAEEMIGCSISRIIPADRQSEEESVLRRIRAGISVDHFETVRQRKDGSLIDISLSVSPIKTPSGTIIGASKIARDITMQRQLLRQAEEANRVKDEFLATLSHELRTPLNAVLGYTRMLRTGRVGESSQERTIETIERNANMLSQLVADVLDVSSIVTGKIRLTLDAADVLPVVRAAVDVVAPSAQSKNLNLRVEMPDAPVLVRCDTDRLQQVFWNLLSNAVKFSPRGGKIDVRVVVNDDVVEVSVADSGIGMRPDVLPYVFQRFWQGESSRSREITGLGLGLALARHFVELHGGTISATSEGEGRGATFTVALPRARS